MYDIDPSRIELAEEFKARPYGEHSPDLQYLLSLMRKPREEPFHVLIVTAPGEQWTLAVMEPGAPAPPQLTKSRGGRVARFQAALAGAHRPRAANRLSPAGRIRCYPRRRTTWPVWAGRF